MSPAFLSLYPKDSEPRKISQREISSQVSAIAVYRFSQIKALTGVLNPCFASLSVKFALQTFTLLFCFFRIFRNQSSEKFRNAKFTLKLARSLHIGSRK